jgi:hypothetical protein
MSVILVKDVPAKVKELIDAHAFFVGQAVIVDLGKALAEEEAALTSAGHCITVKPVLEGDTVGAASGGAVVIVRVAVRFAINPEKATLDLLEMITKGAEAVLDYALNNRADRFELVGFSLHEVDQGLLSYMLLFNKQAILRAP